MTSIRSRRQKGKELEEWIANRLRESGLDPRAYPQKGSGSGLKKGDIWTALDIHIEAKNTAKPKFTEWKKQLKSENVSHLPELLVWHMPQTSLADTQVLISWDFAEELLKSWKGEVKIQTIQNPDLKYTAEKAVFAIKDLLKKLSTS